LEIYISEEEDHMVALFLGFWGTSIMISRVAALIFIPPTVYKKTFSHSHPSASASYSTFVVFVFLIIATLTRVRRNVNVVLVCISFMSNDVKLFSRYWAFVLFLRTVQFICLFANQIILFFWSLIFWVLMHSDY
jgi:hypothetical protein